MPTIDAIPDEILLRIFEERLLTAAIDMNPKPRGIDVPKVLRIEEELRRQKAVYKHRKMAVACGGVCSKWRRVIYTKIYYHISLIAPDTSELDQTLKLLQHSYGSEIQNGSHVRDLHMYFTSHFPITYDQVHELVKQCPNLKRLSIHFSCGGMPPDIIFTAIAQNVSKLTTLIWSESSSISATVSPIYSVLKNAQNLRHLSIDKFIDYRRPEQSSISLPHLRTLYVNSTSIYRVDDLSSLAPCQWSVPSLNAAVIAALYKESKEDLDFFRANGGRLRSLEIRDTSVDLDQISILCPQLQYLTTRLYPTPPLEIHFPSLRRLSIKGLSISEAGIERVTDQLNIIMDSVYNRWRTPMLDTVQLLDIEPSSFSFITYSIPVQTRWLRWLQRMEERNVVFCDGNFNSFHFILNLD